uniref:Metalloendopeptidase n=1 Tax=Lygus hesperus TaxID=30085 RepID=A0A0A9YAL2_LYGHE
MLFMGTFALLYVILFSNPCQIWTLAFNLRMERYRAKVEHSAKHHILPAEYLYTHGGRHVISDDTEEWTEHLHTHGGRHVIRDDTKKLNEHLHTHGGRNVITDDTKKWTDATVFYTVDPLLAQHCQTIVDAMAQISSDSQGCIQFKHAGPTDRNFVRLRPGRGCSSTIGMRPGGQTLTLQDPGCITKSTIMHELLHAVGFCHEHTGPKRDIAVQILWNNINMDPVKAAANFGKMSEKDFTDFNLGFDRDSLMLYNPKAFGKSGNGSKLYTMVSKIPGSPLKDTPNVGLSIKDIVKLRLAYKCDKLRPRPPSLMLMCP